MIIRYPGELDTFIALARGMKTLAFDTETTGLDIVNDRIVGISFALDDKDGYYIPVRHVEGEQLKANTVFKKLKKLLEDPKIRKAGHNLKYDYQMLKHEGITLRGQLLDTKVMYYLLEPNEHNNHLEHVGMQILGVGKTGDIKEMIGRGKKAITMDKVKIETVAPYAEQDAKLVAGMIEILHERLLEQGLEELYYNIEQPLIPILAEMELAGIKISTRPLDEISKRLELEISNSQAKIFSILGYSFNLNSPKQMVQVLFGDLGLPAFKVSSKTGQLSTDEETLQGLVSEHPVIKEILAYRKAYKIWSTYTQKMPKLINKTTGRIHCQLKQCVAATGRLASSDPNLQNIPARDAIGQEIRKAFVAEPGHKLIVADYSQIELRILAHLSGDPTMLRIFREGGDIHKETADAVFHGKLDKKEARHRAKIINFSINYGTSPKSLAKELGTSQFDAKMFMFKYFRKYPRVREFQQELIQETEWRGYSTTLLNRKRAVPDLSSSEKRLRAFGERVALNNPIQGSAADVVKVAMIQTTQGLVEAGLSTRLLLQVHDELVFEAPDSEVEKAKKIIKERMENLAGYLPKLQIELPVSIGVGPSWGEGKE